MENVDRFLVRALETRIFGGNSLSSRCSLKQTMLTFLRYIHGPCVKNCTAAAAAAWTVEICVQQTTIYLDLWQLYILQ
jgi:hypothetical protein